MGVFALHVVGDNDDVDNVCVNGLSVEEVNECWDRQSIGTHAPSPSSAGSLETSKVTQPSGFSTLTILISWRSEEPVPARMERVEGVYESSRENLRRTHIFWSVHQWGRVWKNKKACTWMAILQGNSRVIECGAGPSELRQVRWELRDPLGYLLPECVWVAIP